MRTIVDLPDPQLEALARFCQEQGISRAEAVRRAVDQLIRSTATPPADVGFGNWKGKRLESREYVEKLRGEWAEQ